MRIGYARDFRSRMMFRSNSASAAKTWKTSLPAVVSQVVAIEWEGADPKQPN